MRDFKLFMERIPATAFSKSAFTYCRDNKKTKIWKKIRENLMKNEGKRCWVCGYDKEDARLQAHETWAYDKVNKIMKLKDIHLLCIKCHMIKHPLLWRMEKPLVEHFCKVNKCTEKDFKKHVEDTEKLFIERSKIDWKQDFSLLNKYL